MFCCCASITAGSRRAISMQFAGSSSTGGRRRRRLVVNGDGTGVDMVPIDGDGAEIESQLVASAAAAPSPGWEACWWGAP